MHSFVIKYKNILYGVLGICLFQGIISDYLGFRQVNYLCDILLVLLLVVMLCRKQVKLNKTTNNIEYISILAFAIVALIGWGLNTVRLPSALWGLRNYGRFFLFFLLGRSLWNGEDVETMENFFMKIFPIHMILIAFQYVVEGLNQDFLSGLFGKTAGGNGGLMIYLSVILCIVICQFEYKKISTKKFVCYLLLIFVNAALSELKFLFVLASLLVVWYLAMSKRKGRGMILALFFVIALYVGMQIFYYVFPFWANYLSFDNIMTMISDQEVYANQMDVGRTAVFSKLTPVITKWAGQHAVWFGIGLGNGDYSDAIPMLNSAFYTVYGIMHYTWLSLGYLFVEVGYLGTIVYISFFVILEIKAIVAYQKRSSYYNLLGTFFPIVFMIIIVYNSTLRSNFAYMVFAVLTWQALADEKKEEHSCDSKIY